MEEVEFSPPSQPSKVGEAVSKIISKDQYAVTVGEIIEEYADEYTAQVAECIKSNVQNYEAPFFVVVLHKKEPWALNVMRNWFVARQTKPSAQTLRIDYPNHMHTVYRYDKRSSELKLLWSLPTALDADTILKNGQLYHPDLVAWILNYERGHYN